MKPSFIIKKVVNLFEGNEKAAKQWLNQPSPALGGITPNQAIKQGREKEVLCLIGRLEHGGVF